MVRSEAERTRGRRRARGVWFGRFRAAVGTLAFASAFAALAAFRPGVLQVAGAVTLGACLLALVGQRDEPLNHRLIGFVFPALLWSLGLAGRRWPGSPHPELEVLVAAGAIALAVGVVPDGAARVARWWSRITEPTGWGLSLAVLGVVFYALVTPFGILRRLVNPDPLELRRDSAAQSYWRRRPGPRAPGRYLKQY